jgi:hypothetical protein
MQPNVEVTSDPIRPQYMPPTEGMELDYRTQPYADSVLRWDTVYSVISLGTYGVLATIGLRVLGAYLSSGLFLAIATLVCGAVALFKYLDRQPTGSWGTWLLAGPLIWILSNVSSPAALGFLFPVALLASLLLAHGIIVHFAYWMHAHPDLSKRHRVAWHAVWRTLSWWSHPRGILGLWAPLPDQDEGTTDPEIAALVEAEKQARINYVNGIIAVGVAYAVCVAVLLISSDSLFPGFVSFCVFVLLLVGSGLYTLLVSNAPVSPLLALRVSWRAVISWLNYNRHETAAPGVFRSPCGSSPTRRTQLFTVGLLLALATLPLTAYMPVGMHIFGPQRWLDAAMTPWPWEEIFQTKGSAQQPDTQDGRVGTPINDAYVAQLPANQRRAFRNSMTDLNRQMDRRVKARQRLSATPEAPLVVTLRGAIRLEPAFIASLAISFVCCAMVPFLTIFCLVFAMGAGPLARFHLTLEGGEDGGRALYHPETVGTVWEQLVHRLRDSDFETSGEDGWTKERELILVGFNATHDYPVLIEKPVLNEHVHIMGDSGSGKTALGMAPLLAQLIGRPKTSVVVLDLKGDSALFEAARCGVEEANARSKSSSQKARRLRFRWFTNQTRRSTFAFNPFLQEHIQKVSVQQKASILLQSLGLEYGEGYGQSYYSAVHRNILTKVLRDDPAICSFHRLQRYFDTDLRTRLRDMNIDRKVYQDASHLFTIVDSLASFDALNITGDTLVDGPVLEHQIDMSKVARDPYVAYFYLPSALEEKAVSEIAKLALHSLLTAAVERGPSDHQVYLFIDEFQQVVSANLEIILRQARSQGISVILANHTMEDLFTDSANLIPTVQANTRFKEVFGASGTDQQDLLVRASGETIFTLRSGSFDSNGNYRAGWQEQIGQRIRQNDVIEMTDRKHQCLMQVTRGHGVTQFGGFIFDARTPYHITTKEYFRRVHAAWPEPRQGTLTAEADFSVRDAREIEMEEVDRQRVLSEIEKRLQDMSS